MYPGARIRCGGDSESESDSDSPAPRDRLGEDGGRDGTIRECQWATGARAAGHGGRRRWNPGAAGPRRLLPRPHQGRSLRASGLRPAWP
jgi:hypothetical protein